MMTDWKADELDAIARASELEIALSASQNGESRCR
jgi:hypothetical protein